MSAIWGCVDLSGQPLPAGLCEAMEKPVHSYRVDRYASLADSNVVMGCGVQYIKTWSAREELPHYNRESRTYFTADCIIDNRGELIAELCPGDTDIPDGSLLLLGWRKWGEDTPKHVYGSYAFAAYEPDENRLTIAADHTASRSIHFMRCGERVFFGTVTASLLSGKGGQPVLNETWIALFLAMKPITLNVSPEDTVYKDVYRVAASCVNVFTCGNNMRVMEYWSTDRIQPLRLRSDAEYKEYFRELFFCCARQIVDGVAGETGILLSAGLDSSAVAGAVAPILKERGKELFAYSHVPVDGFVSKYNPRYYMTDERDGILSFCKMYPNIRPHFLPLPECDGFSNIRTLLGILNAPYKALVNLDWIFGLESAARMDGCRLMLTGQVGNGTISWGDMPIYLKHLMTHGKILGALMVFNEYAKIMGYSRKRFIKHTIYGMLPFLYGKDKTDWLAGSFLNRELAARLGIGNGDPRIKMNSDMERPLIYSYSDIRALSFRKTAFAQIADSSTLMSLMNGQVSRDITCDIRMFEFCIASPIECSVDSTPATRRLVRSYLNDLFPPEMISEKWPRGRQSADWRNRIEPNWAQIREDMERVCYSGILEPYIEETALKNALERFRTVPEVEDEYEFMRFGAAYLLGLFMKDISGETLL